jgi:hypothetical protein
MLKPTESRSGDSGSPSRDSNPAPAEYKPARPVSVSLTSPDPNGLFPELSAIMTCSCYPPVTMSQAVNTSFPQRFVSSCLSGYSTGFSTCNILFRGFRVQVTALRPDTMTRGFHSKETRSVLYVCETWSLTLREELD